MAKHINHKKTKKAKKLNYDSTGQEAMMMSGTEMEAMMKEAMKMTGKKKMMK